MVDIQNTEAVNIIRDQAGLSLKEGFPKNLGTTVQPVMDMTPEFHRNTNDAISVSSAGSSGTLISAGSGKRYQILGISISFAKDATQDSASGSLSVTATLNGVSRAIARLPYITLTAERAQTFLNFNRPLEIDKDTAVSWARGASTTGTMRTDIVLYVTELQ